MRQIVFALLLMLSSTLVAALPGHTPLSLASPVKEKNFYLLALLESDSAAVKALERDPKLRTIGEARWVQISSMARNCLSCGSSGRFTEAEIAEASQALRNAYKANASIRQLVDGPLRESGVAIHYESESGADLLAHVWEDGARAINRIIDVYGTGTKRAGEIDGPAFDPASNNARLQLIAELLLEKRNSMPAFFSPSLGYALALLDMNKRDEAGRHEPLEQGENRAAVAAINTITWDKFPYSVIVVPGEGVDRSTFNISPESKMRAELAAIRWRAGKAPLILVSGGYVWPNQAQYSEAIEMKRVLMREFGVPERAILIDPHARHTTTNLRNAARQLWRYGLPFKKTGLITTSHSQSEYIEGADFRARCRRALGYQPVRIQKRVSPVDLEFLPNLQALQIAPSDPLDP